jgi:hypothetical protein
LPSSTRSHRSSCFAVWMRSKCLQSQIWNSKEPWTPIFYLLCTQIFIFIQLGLSNINCFYPF